jgi:hypothetical protein
VCGKSEKDCGTCVFKETINFEKYLHVERAAFSITPVICEF